MELLELVKKSQMGDKKALQIIIDEFYKFIYKKAACFYLKGYEKEDFVQIGIIGLIKAVLKYDVHIKRNFKAYAFKAIHNEMRGVVRQALSKGENFNMSLNELVGEGLELLDFLRSEENIEEKIISKEEIDLLNHYIKQINEEDREVLIWYYIKNKSVNDFAKFKGITRTAAYKKKNRALNRLKKLMSKEK